MLHLILRALPAPLHRLGYRIADTLRKCWYRIARPALIGCRVLAFDEAGKLLLIRHSYGSRQWMLPGGGVKRGEPPAEAAAREVREETGCTIFDLREIATIERTMHGAANTVHILASEARGVPAADNREIAAAGFFAPDALPADMPEWLRAGLPGWITAAKAAGRRAPAPPPAPPPAPTG